MKNLLFYLKVSRPGLWFPTIWLYMLPLYNTEFWATWLFWYGLFYVSFPMNFMVYAWNDVVDYETDKLNPRKDSFLFGARGSKQQLQKLPLVIFLTQLLSYPVFIIFVGWQMLGIFAAQAIVLALYNYPKRGLRSLPPLELCCQFGYVLVAPFSIWCNAVDALPYQTYIYLLLFAVQSHLMGEVMDIEPDRKANRKTTATVLGHRKTKMLIIGLVLIEAYLLFFVFQDPIFGTMLLAGLLWLLIDLFILFKDRQYTVQEMRLFGIGSNLLGLVTMAYVLYTGCLLSIP